jgi:hypothetical protein
MLVLCGLLSAQTPLTEVGFGKLVSDSAFLDFNSSLDKGGWGMQILLNGFKQNLPYLDITQNRTSRYFGMVKVSLVEKWELGLKYPRETTVSLVKLHLRLFIFDVAEQRELMRETVATYAGVTKVTGLSGNIVLLKRAFEDALAVATQRIAQRFPLVGSIRKVEGREITADLGEDQGLNDSSILEVLAENGESMGRFKVTQVQGKECKAMPESYGNFTLRPGFVVRMVPPPSKILTKEEAFVKANFAGPEGTVVVGKKTPIGLAQEKQDLGFNDEPEDTTPPIKPVTKPKEVVKKPTETKLTDESDLSLDGDAPKPVTGEKYSVLFSYFNDKSKLERAYQAIKKLESKNLLKIADVKQPNARNMTLRLVYPKSQRELWDELKKQFQREAVSVTCQLKDSEIVVTEK